MRGIPSEKVIEKRFKTAFRHISLPRQELRYGSTRTEGLWFWKRVAGSIFSRMSDDALTSLTRSLFKRFERASAWTVFSGARRVLRKLKGEGITVGLLSNWDARGPELLRKLQLQSIFSTIVFSFDVGFEKPDPRIFDELVNRLNGSFERIVMIGNHVKIDLEVPNRRGWDTLLYRPGSEDHWKQEVSGWDEVSDQIFN